MRNPFTRESYIPKGSVKVSDKKSSAVAYLYASTSGKLHCVAFAGKADKPAGHYSFPSEKSRENYILQHFETTRRHEASRIEHAATRKAFAHSFKVGDVFRTCWGYDQTNVEFFECTAVRGKMIEVREIARETKSDGGMAMSGRCVPMVGMYTGEPLRRIPTQYGVKIDDVRRASLYEPQIVAGTKIYKPASYSWGA